MTAKQTWFLYMTCDVSHGNKQTKCSLYKYSFYQPAGLQMAWNMEQSDRKNTLVGPLPTSVPQSGLSCRVWCRPSPLQRLTFSMLAGIKAHLPHMPLFLFEPNIGHQKCDTVVMSSHCPRYTGSYQTPTGPG